MSEITASPRGYPLPHPDNNARNDALGIRSAIEKIDTEITAQEQALTTHATTTQSALNTKADAATVQEALDTKADAAATQEALGTKADAAATQEALDTKADAAAMQETLATLAQMLTPNVYKHIDKTDRSFSTSWGNGAITPEWSFKAGSKILLHINIPMRNDSDTWGGGYTEVSYQLSGQTTWLSLGNSGFDGPMAHTGNIIVTYVRTLLIDPEATTDFGIRFRLRHRSYSDTLRVNGLHNIDGDDFYTTLIAEEKL